MSPTLAERTAMRIDLQEQASAERRELRQAWADVEHDVQPVDRFAETVRRLAPLAAVAGIVVMIVVGPAKALVVARRGLAVAMAAREAMRLLRGFRA